jgi:Na+-translocating ferredoxin:NAD+ oxidoreductase RnfG subunit
VSNFTIKCHGIYAAKRFKVKPYLNECVKEEYKVATCAYCGTLVVELIREFKKKNGITRKQFARKKGNNAQTYLDWIKGYQQQTEIVNFDIEKGCKGNINWLFGKNNNIYNFNDKRIIDRRELSI